MEVFEEVLVRVAVWVALLHKFKGLSHCQGGWDGWGWGAVRGDQDEGGYHRAAPRHALEAMHQDTFLTSVGLRDELEGLQEVELDRLDVIVFQIQFLVPLYQLRVETAPWEGELSAGQDMPDLLLFKEFLVLGDLEATEEKVG